MPMDLLRKARDLEAKIASKLDRTVGDLMQSGAREPLEVVHAIVEAVDGEIQSSGRGRRVFPFNTIAVTILAPSRDVRARFEALLADGPSLQQRIVDRLQSAGCDGGDVEVTVGYETKPKRGWRTPEFHVELARVARPERQQPVVEIKPLRVEVTVLHGTAERRTYVFASSRIDLGRCAEVRDSTHRLIRTNHVAFVERPGDVNQSVSRQHAHIAYEPAAGQFRLRDDGSAHGTGIVRRGRTVPVPRGARGVRLEHGDEIVLGDARIRFKLLSDTGSGL
jgi:pSer/pThr/pTyr-binding forkhead associated (FHA) protein